MVSGVKVVGRALKPFGKRLEFIVSDIIGLAWPLLVGIVIIYFRKEIKAALSRITEIGPTGFKLDTAATAQQIATTPATANVLISNIKQAISADQLTPALNQVKKELLSQSQNKDEQIDI